MEKLTDIKVRLIKSEEEYAKYCQTLEQLGNMEPTTEIEDLIEVIELVISEYNERMFSVADSDPISFLKDLMETHNLNQQDLCEILGISKSSVSLIMNYQRGLSKDVIRKLSAHFSMKHEAFNRPYTLITKRALNDSNGMDPKKEVGDNSYRLNG